MLGLSGDWEEEFELRRELIFSVKSVGEVNSSNSAVGMYLNSECLDVVSPVSSSCEIRQVELNLIPSFVQAHRHRADKRFDSCG